MKKKISRILGVGLTVALLLSMLVVMAPASAGTLSWGAESSITDLKNRVDNIIAPAGLNIVDIAIAGDTIYAATSSTTYPLYKSTDGGQTWASLASTSSFPSGVSVKAVAIARDSTNTVVIATSANEIEFSSNAGSSWTDLDAPQTSATIYDVDVSPDGSYIAVGSDNGTSTAQLSTMYLAMAQTWQQRVTLSNPGFETQDAVFAVKFSPNFGTDKIISVVTGNTTTGHEARFQVFRYEAGALTWNGAISFFDTSDWASGLNLGTMTGGLARADIILPDSYLGNDTGSRVGFIALAATTSGGGVIRIDDTYQRAFQTWSSGDEGDIGSIAYSESGILLAGDYDNNQVYVSLSPMASSPKFERLNNLKQPGGASRTLVGWSGANAVATTSGDESAFAISSDSGYSFNDTSLIDTVITAIDDIAVSSDGSVVYMTTTDTADGGTNDVSVWVKASNWTRVYSAKDVATANAAYMVRVAPDNASAVYIASKGTTNMWVSKDMGKTLWKSIPVYKLTTLIQDYVVASADVVYAIDATGLTKTSNAGASWGTKKSPTDTFSAHMVALAPNGDILVGGSTGYVAYSKDGGSTLTRTKITVAGNVHVAADDGYATNNILYAGVGTKVYRGKADSTTAWTARAPSITTGHAVTGLVQQGGFVYALTANTTASELFRSLTLETAGSTDADTWSSKTTTALLNTTPKALFASTGSVKLWAVDTEAAALYSFLDNIADTAPTMKSPANGFDVTVNPGTGQAYNVNFSVDRQNSSITAIQIEIAVDSGFAGIVWNNAGTDISVTTTTTTLIVGPTGSGNNVAQFMPGDTYYWRTRSVTPLYSPWSATRSFKVDAPVAFAPVSPALGATGVSTSPTMVWSPYEGALHYEITVSKDADFTFAEYSHNVPVENTFYKSEELDYGTTYYWKVRGITGTTTGRTPAPGGPWTIGTFTTMDEPKEEAPPVVVQQPSAPEVKIVEVPVPGPVVQQAIPDYLLWTVIVIGAVLIIALIVLIVRTRRVA